MARKKSKPYKDGNSWKIPHKINDKSGELKVDERSDKFSVRISIPKILQDKTDGARYKRFTASSIDDLEALVKGFERELDNAKSNEMHRTWGIVEYYSFDILLNDFIENYSSSSTHKGNAKKVSLNTKRFYRIWINEFFKFCQDELNIKKPIQVGEKDVEKFAKYQIDLGRKESTLRVKIAALILLSRFYNEKAMFKFGKRENPQDYYPNLVKDDGQHVSNLEGRSGRGKRAIKHKKSGSTKYNFDFEKFFQLLDFEHRFNYSGYYIILMQLCLGLRISETISILKDNIDHDSLLIFPEDQIVPDDTIKDVYHLDTFKTLSTDNRFQGGLLMPKTISKLLQTKFNLCQQKGRNYSCQEADQYLFKPSKKTKPRTIVYRNGETFHNVRFPTDSSAKDFLKNYFENVFDYKDKKVGLTGILGGPLSHQFRAMHLAIYVLLNGDEKLKINEILGHRNDSVAYKYYIYLHGQISNNDHIKKEILKRFVKGENGRIELRKIN